MPIEFLSVTAFIGSAVISLLLSSRFVAKGVQIQQEVLQRGAQAQGRIVKVWRPPLAGSFPRIYFEFEPLHSQQTIRCCHIDRRPYDDCAASLPAAGTAIAVRYLPENPAQAVIARLVARWRG